MYANGMPISVLLRLIVIMFIINMIKVNLAREDVYGALDTDQLSRPKQIGYHD